MRSVSWVVLVALLTVLSCGKDRVVKTSDPLIGDQIVFVSSHADYFEHLYVANADGSGVQALTTDSIGVLEPQWSPDGRKIVFLRWYGPLRDSLSVTVVNSDGSNRVRLTQDRADVYPSWSPDGSKIAYERNADSPVNRALWIMNADGSGQHMLYDADSLNGVSTISWATADYLVGASGLGLHRLRADGSGVEQVISLLNDYAYPNPRVSPDGARIAFAYQPTDSQLNIYTVDWDGTDLKKITTSGAHGFPEWSSDGTKIGYVGDSSELWNVNVDGSNPTKMGVSAAFPEGTLGWDWK